MGLKAKLKAAKSWLGSHRPRLGHKSREHIISTHMEDVSMDFTEGTPRGGKAFGDESKLCLDSTALTKILDANDKVQVALKGWYDLENKMKAEWVKQDLEHTGMGRHTQHGKKDPTGLSVMDAISHQLHAVQRMPGIGGEGNCLDQIDSMSSDATQSHSFTVPVTSNNSNGGNNLWVDFSDSSGSQLSRQSPGASAGTPGWRTPYVFHTPRDSWASAPRRSSAKGRIGGSLSPDLSSSATDRPHSVVSGNIVPHFNWNSPFTSTAAVYGTPRLVQSEVITRNAELRHSSSFPRYNNNNTMMSEQDDSEFASCTSRELSAAGTWTTAKSSLREMNSGVSDTLCATGGDYSIGKAMSATCDIKQDCDKVEISGDQSHGNVVDVKPKSPVPLQQDSLSMVAEKCGPGTPLAADLERNSWHSAGLTPQCQRPVLAKKRRASRRIPPALRVRFTPEHLKDVLLRVGDNLSVSSRSKHCKMPVTRF